MTRLGTDVALHLPIELGTDLGGGGGGPVLEVPEQIPGLMAWFDSRSLPHLVFSSGNSISGWLSRAGALGSIPWAQSTFANQPVLVASAPTLNNMPAVQLDGVDDSFLSSNSAAWTFLHNGTGHSVFRVFRMDSTGQASQRFHLNAANANGVGMLEQHSTAFIVQLFNGSAVTVNQINTTVTAHISRDVSKWQMHGHGAGVGHARVTGSSITMGDTGGPVSAAVSSLPMRFGAGNSTSANPVKGLVPQEIYYDHVLTAGETTQLANWAASLYGVAA